MVQGVPGFVDVPERAHLQTFMSSLIDSAGDIPVRFIQKIQRRTQGAIRIT